MAVDSIGNVYVADTDNQTIRKITALGEVTTIAGTVGWTGSEDGRGAAAHFWQPAGISVDSAGTLYIADQSNHTIRKMMAGVVTTLAGNSSGSADGTGAAASFDLPTGVAVDHSGEVYVADLTGTVRKVTAAGRVTTQAGTSELGSNTDGVGAAAGFDFPSGLAVDVAGNVYVSDDGSHALRRITPAGAVTTLRGVDGPDETGHGEGTPSELSPFGIAVDRSGNVYISEQGTMIRRLSAAGVVTRLAGGTSTVGSTDGSGAFARFNGAADLAIDGAGSLYIADQRNATVRKLSSDGLVTTLAGAAETPGSDDGTAIAARFARPAGLAVDSAGTVYVADEDNSTIRKITAAGLVTTLAGTAGMPGSADGNGAAARFDHPTGVALDDAGNVYVADRGNATIRKITVDGTTTTIAGTAKIRGIVLGPVPRFASPQRLAIAGDSLVIIDSNAVLGLRRGARD